MSAQCTALRGELRHLGSPSLLGDLARNAPRWAETVIELGDWPAAADALDLGARAADELFRRLPPGDRPRAIAEFRRLALDAASALARAGRLDESLVMLERARQRIVRFWRAARGTLACTPVTTRVPRSIAPPLCSSFCGS
jgi:hypothetical protein